MKEKKDYLKYPTISKLSSQERYTLEKKAEINLRDEKLEKLKFLYDSGVLTQEEYESKKNDVLGEKKEETTIHTDSSNVRTEPKKKVVQNSLRKDLPQEEKIINPTKNESPKKKGSKLPVYIGILAVIIVGVLGYQLFGKGSSTSSNSTIDKSSVEETSESEQQTEKQDSNNQEDTSDSYLNNFDTVTLGTYQGESIEWIVLDEKEDGAKLLLSKYILDDKAYNEEYTEVTWETCTLREYLNNDFYNEAFSTEEQSKTQTTIVVNEDNEEYGTEGGNDTEDKIFLLSIDEVNKYFSSDEERACKPTEYAKERGIYVNKDGNTWYWLRSPGYHTNYAAFVDYGYVFEDGDCVNFTCGIRPAMWIQI